MKNILLIGLGRFGKHIAIQSSQLGHEIMAVDLDEERVNEALPYVTNAQIGDSTNEEFLKSLGIANYDICFVTIGGNFQNSLETTCLLKELGGKMVISRAERDVQEKFLLRNGADKVVYPEKMVAKWATIRYTDDHILDYMEVDASHAIFEVEVPKEWIGKTVGKLDIRKKYDINIMAVKDDGKVSMAISADTCLKCIFVLLFPYGTKNVISDVCSWISGNFCDHVNIFCHYWNTCSKIKNTCKAFSTICISYTDFI